MQVLPLTLVGIFVLCYAAIALEHPLKVNKSASALIGAGLLWTVYALLSGNDAAIVAELNDSLASTAQIVFFLVAAMTIVEVVDAYDGFALVTSRVNTKSLPALLWLLALLAFFLSAILDNLTTTIVLISLTRKLLARGPVRLLFAAMIVIAANAGGAWSPIGDVTTTMLWIGGQITPLAIIKGVFLPAVVSLVVPLLVVTWSLRGQVVVAPERGAADEAQAAGPTMHSNLMFFFGLGILVLVPVFKAATNLPPFIGILFGLGLLWLLGDLLHRNTREEEKEHLTLVRALRRIDMSSIVFFIGILLAVAALEHTHVLTALARWLDLRVGRQDLIVLLLGLLSAVVDNVPLVAASMAMYSLNDYAADSFLWEFMAYCVGTGGSILIIGSAAGVAAMGLEKIDFLWYARRISGLALLGYLAGALVYIVQYRLLH